MEESDDRPVSSRKLPARPARIYRDRSNSNKLSKGLAIAFKFLEICAGLVCLGLLRYYYLLFDFESRLFMGVITTGGFVLISGVLLLGYVMGSNSSPMQEAIINLLGAVLYIGTGAMAADLYLRFDQRSEKTRVGLVFGALAIANGVVYVVDAAVAIRRGNRQDDD